jgi:hypothetical protein
MKTLKRKSLIKTLLILILIFMTSACGQISKDASYILSENESVHGSLFIFSQNATLEEGSSVDGSVIMLCCNLKVEGDVTGDIYLLTGNVMINAYADVDGDVHMLTGNVSP